MKIVLATKSLMLAAGLSPFLYLMIALSFVSSIIILDRAWLFAVMREDAEALVRDLGVYLSAGDLEGARARFLSARSAEAAVVAAGLVQATHGPEAAAEAMEGAMTRERLRLEHRLSFLGTLGNNAPFIGLLGTVIGVIMTFDRFGQAGPDAHHSMPIEVMSSIAEALVATGIGLAVAIPAGAASDHFQHRIAVIRANADVLTRALLAYLRGGVAELPRSFV